MSKDPLNLAGLTVADHAIVRFRGSGAAGYVYEARVGQERVALKIYKDWLFETDATSQDRRIEREDALHRIQHPNVCGILGSGRALVNGTERRYLAMEFIDGESLDTLIKTGIFVDWKAFADVTRQLFDGVSAVHAAGHVHRDIKPANIMMEQPSSRVVLADFGVIADLEGATLLTESHEFLGTIAYAAPEWLLREGSQPARSFSIDVYSLGATLYEMLTGERIFADKRNRHQLARAVTDTIPTVHAPTGFPITVASLVREMLAKVATNRPTLEEARSRFLELALNPFRRSIAITESALTDPYERLRQTMSRREDVRRSADQERLRSSRWNDFESMWKRLEMAWNHSIARLSALPAIVESRTYWRGEPHNADWHNRDSLERSFPDRTWEWARSFDFEVASPGRGVQVVYFFHGLEDQRTGITRFVATLGKRHRDRTPIGEAIQTETAKSWMAPLDQAIDSAVADVPAAEELAVTLLEEINRS